MREWGRKAINGILAALPIVVVIFGVVSFMLAYWAFPAPSGVSVTGTYFVKGEDGLHEVFLSLGQALLAGGVFAAILKSMQFTGFYKSALFDIVFGDKYLNTRSDLQDVWRRVSSAMYKKNFYELENHLLDVVVDRYIPVNKDFYYKNYKRKCVIDWVDKEKTMVYMHEELSLEIVPVRKKRKYFISLNFAPARNP